MKRQWIFYAGLTLVLWSTLAYLSTLLIQVPPFLLLGITLLIGSLPSIHRYRDWFANLPVLALGVGGIFGYHLFFFMALRMAPPVEANLLNYLWPILIVLLSPIFFKEYKLGIKHLIGASVAGMGAVLVVSGGQLHFETKNILGYISAVLAALVWSLYSVTTKKVKPFPTTAVGGFCFISGLLALLIHFVFEGSTHLVRADWIAMIAMGLGPLGIAFYTWDKAMKEGDPRVVGSLAYLEPLLSSFVLIHFGNKPLTLSFVVSLILIISGAVFSSI